MEYQSQEIGELAKALAKAQGMFEGVERDAKNPFFKSKYADLHSVFQACRGPLSQNGLAVTQTDAKVDGQESIITTLMHASGQWIKSVTPLFITKRDSQGYGSSHTYAKRYALQAIVGLSSYDDDGQEASKPAKSEKQEKHYTVDDLVTKLGNAFDKKDVQEFLKYGATLKKVSEDEALQAIMANDASINSFGEKLHKKLNVPVAIDVKSL